MSSGKWVATNLMWRFMERLGTQGIIFIVSIVLARKLDPTAYGTVAIVTVIIGILQVFIDSGFGNALIQKKEVDDVDYSTVFYFNLLICFVVYVLLYFISPLIARFYKISELTPVIRVLGLSVIISGVKNIQQAYVARNMLFKRFFFATLGGTIGAAFISVYLAYKGYGVWALVVQSLFSNCVDTGILWLTVKWRPKMCFSFERLGTLFSFGWKLLFVSLIETIYNDLCQLIIGKKYAAEQLAFYNKGKQFPNYIVTNINSSIKSVLFPVFSMKQDNIGQLKLLMRRSIQLSNFAITPLIFGLAAVAENFVELVLTEKWLFCIPYLRLFCISYLLQPIQTTNKNVIKALGKSELLLKTQVLLSGVGIILIAVTMNFGVMPMACSVVLTNLFEQYLLARQNKKLVGYGYFDQCKDMMPPIALSLIMGTAVYLINYISLPSGVKLILQILTGMIIYLTGAVLTRNEAMGWIFNPKSDRNYEL